MNNKEQEFAKLLAELNKNVITLQKKQCREVTGAAHFSEDIAEIIMRADEDE